MKWLKVPCSTLKKGFFCLPVSLLFFAESYAQPSGYSYAKTITIQSSQVSGTLSNFPVLISFTDNSLRTVANGGRVQNANGYDIVFTASNCSVALPHQIERYVASTGEYVAWVNVPSVTSASNTTITMYYGNAAVSANPSSTSVWDAGYMGVWHFNNSINDATSNTRNLIDSSSGNFSGSKIGEGRQLNNNPSVYSGSGGQFLRVPSNILTGVTSFSFEGWVYLDNNTTNWERIFDFGRNATYNMFLTPSLGGNGARRFAITINGSGSEQRASATGAGSSTGTGAWHHFALTIDNGTNTAVLYYDGAADANNTSMTLRPNNMPPDTSNYFGKSQYTGADHLLYGKLDEFRLSNTARSANWIATSYRNQNNPSAFYTVSSEVSAISLCSVLPVQISTFGGVVEPNATVTLNWTSAQELNNEKFIVERSADGNSWEAIKTIAGSGTTTSARRYTVQDNHPVYPISHYRLKQVDANGLFTYSSTITIKLNKSPENNTPFTINPNPAQGRVKIECNENVVPQELHIELLSSTGVKIPVQPSFMGRTIALEMPAVASGIYFLNIYKGSNKYSQKLLIVQ